MTSNMKKTAIFLVLFSRSSVFRNDVVVFVRTVLAQREALIFWKFSVCLSSQGVPQFPMCASVPKERSSRLVIASQLIASWGRKLN
jgi:hypothetical protein